MGPQQSIKIKDYDKTCKKRQTLLNKHFCKNNLQVSAILAEKIADFHFSHYKSMETLSCHSSQSSYPPGIKNTNYVEATVRNMFTKYRLHPQDSF